MTEDNPVCELLKSRAVYDTVEARGPSMTTRNLAELERDVAQLERMMIPLLNQVREMLGKKPVIVPKG